LTWGIFLAPVQAARSELREDDGWENRAEKNLARVCAISILLCDCHTQQHASSSTDLAVSSSLRFSLDGQPEYSYGEGQHLLHSLGSLVLAAVLMSITVASLSSDIFCTCTSHPRGISIHQTLGIWHTSPLTTLFGPKGKPILHGQDNWPREMHFARRRLEALPSIFTVVQILVGRFPGIERQSSHTNLPHARHIQVTRCSMQDRIRESFVVS